MDSGRNNEEPAGNLAGRHNVRCSRAVSRRGSICCRNIAEIEDVVRARLHEHPSQIGFLRFIVSRIVEDVTFV